MNSRPFATVEMMRHSLGRLPFWLLAILSAATALVAALAVPERTSA